MTDGLGHSYVIDSNILHDPDHVVVDLAVASLAASVIFSENSEASASEAISGGKHCVRGTVLTSLLVDLPPGSVVSGTRRL